MSLAHFLSGRAPRTNPAPPWRIERRYAEGGAWGLLAAAETEEGAREEILAHTGRIEPGDLVRLVGPGRATALVGVGTGGGLVDPGVVPEEAKVPELAWEAFWEGPAASADAMLRVAQACPGLDHRRLVSAALDCAAAALGGVQTGDPRPREALVVARRCVRGLARAETVALASDAANEAASEAEARSEAPGTPLAEVEAGRRAVRAFMAVVNAADTLTDEGEEDAAELAALSAARSDLALGPVLVKVVRRWVPLSVLLRARAGEMAPWDPRLLEAWGH